MLALPLLPELMLALLFIATVMFLWSLYDDRRETTERAKKKPSERLSELSNSNYYFSEGEGESEIYLTDSPIITEYSAPDEKGNVAFVQISSTMLYSKYGYAFYEELGKHYSNGCIQETTLLALHKKYKQKAENFAQI